jgi:energy-coupling factor transport system ATP-binding protein
MRIEIANLTFQYRDNLPLFQDVNLSIPLQKWVAITGNSGSGKTSLAKLISGLIKPESGRIVFQRNEIPRNEIPNSRVHFGYLFQNPDDQFVHFNIEREVAFNLENRNVDPAVMKEKVKLSLMEIGLFGRKSDSPNNLSGGEKQRLALAGMMISQPDVLILDEPCSFLDIFTQIQLFQKIDELRKRKVSIIWITQEDHEIKMADYVIRLDEGRVIFTGSREDYIKHFGMSDGKT